MDTDTKDFREISFELGPNKTLDAQSRFSKVPQEANRELRDGEVVDAAGIEAVVMVLSGFELHNDDVFDQQIRTVIADDHSVIHNGKRKLLRDFQARL